MFLYNLPNSCIALLFGITGAALFAGVLFLRGLSLREYANSIVNDEWPQLSKSRVSGRTTRLLRELTRNLSALDPEPGRQSLIYPEMLKKFDELTADYEGHCGNAKSLSYFGDLLLGDGPRVAADLAPELRPGVADAVGSMMPAISGVSILPTLFFIGRVLRYFVGVQRSDDIPPMRIWERPLAASVATTSTTLPGLR